MILWVEIFDRSMEEKMNRVRHAGKRISAGRAAVAAVALLCLLAPCTCSRAQDVSASTHLRLTRQVLQRSVTRLGINMGGQNFYDSGQMARNLIFRNPGFEGLAYRSIFHCAQGGEGQCVDVRGGIEFPQNFWNGAAYEVLDGAPAGRRGVVKSAGVRGGGFAFSLDGNLTLHAGDWISVYKGFFGEPTAGWWPKLTGGAELDPERGDLPPGTQGKQALRMTALVRGSSARVSSYFDTSEGLTFIHLRGRYRLSFRAKPLSGGVLHVDVARHAPGLPPYFSRELPLVKGWKQYSEEFEVHEPAAMPPAAAEVAFAVAGGSVLLDDVSFEKVDGDPANHTAYRDELLESLRALHPGLLRMMGSYDELGSTVDNLLQPASARVRSGYHLWYTPTEDIPVGIPEFLELCREVDAEPWIALPAAMSVDEARKLAEYMAGPVSTPGGALRASEGRSAPWTGAFHTLHLELGNETWNAIYAGESMESAEAYGRRANLIFAAFRAAAGGAASSFDLIVGTNAADSSRNRALLAAAPLANTLAIAPYLMPEVNHWATEDELYGPLLAEPEQMSREGSVHASHGSADGRQLAVYEVNLHTTRGAIPQEALDRLTPSAAAGIAVAGHMLRMMRDHGVRNQALFALPQYQFKREDGKHVRLWGSVVELGAEGRKRPQFLAESLANRILHGDMVRVELTGANPTRDQLPGNSGVALRAMHEIDAYGFRDGHKAGLVVFNYGLHRSHSIVIDSPGSRFSATASIARLESPSASATNETSEQVRIVSEPLRDNVAVLPPCSMIVVEWPE